MSHIPVAGDFRARMMYNNFMYRVVGQVAEKMEGKPWAALVKERFFDLLGMTDATFIHLDDIKQLKDFAKPHMAVKGVTTELDLDIHRYKVLLVFITYKYRSTCFHVHCHLLSLFTSGRWVAVQRQGQ